MGLEAVGLHYHALNNFFITKAEYGNFHVNLNVPVQLFPDRYMAQIRYNFFRLTAFSIPIKIWFDDVTYIFSHQ